MHKMHKMHKKHSKKSQKKKSRSIVGRAKAGVKLDSEEEENVNVGNELTSLIRRLNMGAANITTDAAQAATAVARALPVGQAGPLVVMSARSRGPRGAPSSSRSNRDARMSAVGSRSSSRAAKKTKKYSPPKTTVSASRKAAAKKAAATRKKNIKTAADKRRAAAVKGANTRRANELSNLFTGFGL